MSNFTFNEEYHCYELDGKPLPSVTRILRPLVDFSAVPRDLLERARAYGVALHRTVELYLLNDLDESTLDEPLVKPLEAFKVWTMDHPEFNLETAAIERPGYHPKLKYAGTPDLDGEDFIIDLKSRAFNRTTDPIQLAGYANFGKPGREWYILELKQDGTYVFTRVDGTAAAKKRSWERFRYLLDFYKMSQEIKRWK